MATANGLFPYSQTGPADLHGSIWDAPEGQQNYPVEDDFQYTYGHITPRGQDQTETMGDISSKWIGAEQAPAAVSEPMRRISSRSSSGSHKHRTIKASKQKSRPRLLSTVSQGSRISDFDITGNTSMDAYLLPDSDAQSVSSQMYYPTLPMTVGLPTDGLSFSATGLAPGMTQHVDPMQLNFDASLGGSPSASWGSSPVESRISSPGLPEDASAWSLPMDASPTHTSDSSPVMDNMSPRYVI